MKLFVETSAIAAIILQEEGWEALAEKIRDNAGCFTSSVAMFEATLALRQQRELPASAAYSIVRDFLATCRMEIVPVPPEVIDHAVEAAERYGAGRYRLNLGDCISYAAAKHHHAPMLYVGKDFAQTDLA